MSKLWLILLVLLLWMPIPVMAQNLKECYTRKGRFRILRDDFQQYSFCLCNDSTYQQRVEGYLGYYAYKHKYPSYRELSQGRWSVSADTLIMVQYGQHSKPVYHYYQIKKTGLRVLENKLDTSSDPRKYIRFAKRRFRQYSRRLWKNDTEALSQQRWQ